MLLITKEGNRLIEVKPEIVSLIKASSFRKYIYVDFLDSVMQFDRGT